MKIIYICPGTGDAFYCENCIRDEALISGFRALGHDVGIVPMYLPIAMKTDHPVMFGAVRLYLIDKYPILKKLPDKLLRTLDRRAILDMAAGVAGSTRAGGHEEMTISMIEGESGKFADEFEKTVDYMLAQKPDMIIVPNGFLIGVLSAVKAKDARVKTVCFLQDEHVWVDVFAEKYRERTWRVIAEKSKSADALLTHSGWYRDKVAGCLGISPEKISVVPFGVDVVKSKTLKSNSFMGTGVTAPVAQKGPVTPHLQPTMEKDYPKTLLCSPGGNNYYYRKSKSKEDLQYSDKGSFVIGYLSRLCKELGVDVLVDAYCLLLEHGVLGDRSAIDFCGGYTKDDFVVVESCRKKIADAGGRMVIREKFDVGTRAEFFSGLSILSVPTRDGIAFGGFISEAMAAGVPVVMPDIGGFSEVVAETGAGVLYSPNTSDALAVALEKLIRDNDARRAMADAGRKAVSEKYNHMEMARETIGTLRTMESVVCR